MGPRADAAVSFLAHVRNRLLTASFLVAALALGAVGHRLASRLRASMPAEDDALYLPSAGAIRVLSLGHVELAADLVYLRTIVYFGTSVVTNKKFDALSPLFDTIIALDPHWKRPYRWAGVATMYNGLPITPAMVRESTRYLKAGIAQFPDDWELPFMVGSNDLFELHPTDPREKKKLVEEGAAYIERAALVGGAPSWMPLLAATILRKDGQQEAAIHHLEQVYYATSDDKTRQEVRNRLLSLKADVDFARADQERADFEARWHKELPYAPSGLFVLLDTKELDLDWRVLIKPTAPPVGSAR